MERNGELLLRARRMRQLRRQSGGQAQQRGEGEARPPAHVSHHASYTALMRSHDRVRSRHTGGQS